MNSLAVGDPTFFVDTFVLTFKPALKLKKIVFSQESGRDYYKVKRKAYFKFDDLQRQQIYALLRYNSKCVTFWYTCVFLILNQR